MWPFPSAPSDFERQVWDKLWSLPQAIEWEKTRQEELVALYVQTYTAAALAGGDTKLLAETRQLDLALGISQKAIRGLGWDIDDPDDVEEIDEPAEPKESRVYVPRKPGGEE